MATDAAPDPRAGPLAAAAPDPRRKLSEELDLILREFEVETVTLREVIGILHGRGYVLLVMLLALPFCTPIPLPGLSTPLGLVIALIVLIFGGAGLALRQTVSDVSSPEAAAALIGNGKPTFVEFFSQY